MLSSLQRFMVTSKDEKNNYSSILNEEKLEEMYLNPLSKIGKETRQKLFEEITKDDELFRSLKQHLRRQHQYQRRMPLYDGGSKSVMRQVNCCPSIHPPERSTATTNEGIAVIVHTPESLRTLGGIYIQRKRASEERSKVEKEMTTCDKEQRKYNAKNHEKTKAGQDQKGQGDQEMKTKISSKHDRSILSAAIEYGRNFVLAPEERQPEDPVYTVVEKKESCIRPAMRKASEVLERGRKMVLTEQQKQRNSLKARASNGITDTLLRRAHASEGNLSATRNIAKCDAESRPYVRSSSANTRQNQVWNFARPASSSARNGSWRYFDQQPQVEQPNNLILELSTCLDDDNEELSKEFTGSQLLESFCSKGETTFDENDVLKRKASDLLEDFESYAADFWTNRHSNES